MRDDIRFYLNGQPHTARGEEAFVSVTDYLRVKLGLVGTKVVCAEGDCGACTVLVGRPERDRIRYVPVDCCIQFVYQLDGRHVVTVEGLSRNGDLHPVQQALVDHHGSQCGYCTPGIVMALAGWAEVGPERGPARIALTGNLCRCTGYVPIFDAAAAVAANAPPPLTDNPERIAELLALAAEPVKVEVGQRVFFAPTTLADAVAFKAARPDAVIVAGGTELGVLRNKRGDDPPALLCLTRIPGLGRIEHRDGQLIFGGNTTWTQVEDAVRDLIPEFHRIILRFGSPQIRNVATLVGNVAHGSPIADSLGLLMVMDAEIEIVGPRGTRQRPLAGFYTGYKQKDLAPDELITRVTLPLPAENERLRLYKVSRRNDLDIATFGAAIRVSVDAGIIRAAAVAFTGVAATVVRLPVTEATLVGQPFSESTFRRAGRDARREIRPITDVRGLRDFRLQLAENILTKFYFDEISTVAAEVPA